MLAFFRYMVSRLIKIIANLIKIVCYIFDFLFPRKRFKIPGSSNPLFFHKDNKNIPKIIWQTNYTDNVSLPVYINYLFNRLMAPTYHYRFMTDDEIVTFIAQNYSSDIFDLYSSLQIGASQADFWRILILQHHGGVYMDIDSHLVWPLELIIKPEYTELYLLQKDLTITNYFLASKKDNSNLDSIIKTICNNIREKKIKSIYLLTGPTVLINQLKDRNVRTAHYRTTCNQGNFTNEYFQYIDKKDGKWWREQKKIDVIKE